MRTRSVLLVGGVLLLATGVGSAPAPREEGARIPSWFIDQIAERDDGIRVARLFRVRSLMGKSLSPTGRGGPVDRAKPLGRVDSVDRTSLTRGDSTSRRSIGETQGELSTTRTCRRGPGRLEDAPIANVEELNERRPSVAVRVRDPKTVVAAFVASPFPEDPRTRCAVRHSRDAGRTWSDPVDLKLLNPESICLDPVLAWSPDGKWLYAAYRNVMSSSEDLPAPPGTVMFRTLENNDIVVSRSRDEGETWSKPIVALDADPWGATVVCRPGELCDFDEIDPGFSYSWPGLAVSTYACTTGWVYVTGTRIAFLDETAPPTAIAFTRARSSAVDWSEPVVLDSGSDIAPGVTVHGSKPAAGVGAEVLVAWYHSGVDGRIRGDFEIRTARSGNHGATWGPPVTAAVDGEETDFWLGPARAYKRWWTTMYPDIAIDRGSRAYVVYTHDPEPGDLTAEEGDIRYITSTGAPYDAWSLPVTVNDDGYGRAQGLATVSVRHRGHSSIVDVIWEDTRLAPEGTDQASLNLYYDIFHSRLVPGQDVSWSPNVRVSDESSLQDGLASGERLGLGASHAILYGAWTDRRMVVGDVDDPATDIYGSRIHPGRGVRY